MKRAESKPLILRDELHGDISFDPFLKEVIDHPSFQRLRYIKQLGLAEYVFPCATHTRFQHSLGAAYLAGQYFDAMVKVWLVSPFTFEGTCEKTRFFSRNTRSVLEAVAKDRYSWEFWHHTVSLGGLLHDVGHGPWSHTFEYLELKQDFSSVLRRIKGTSGEYFQDLLDRGQALKHEDISVLYIFQILSDLTERKIVANAVRYFLPVALLVNKKMLEGKFKKSFERELSDILRQLEVKGGVDIHRLLRPIISGPFDVDRIDYIQRDGRNCGVQIGGIEWRRIVTKVVPCLSKHAGENSEPSDVILVSNIKNHHVLDDFTFSLFQMYAQVYMHPKIVGIEEISRKLLMKRVGSAKNPVVTFDLHQSLSDEKFRILLKEDFGVPEIERLLLRMPEASFKVVSLPSDTAMEKELKAHGFSLIDTQDRPMMKDRLGVFLFSGFRNKGGKKTYIVRPWEKVSPIAKQTFAIHYSPNIWLQSSVGGKSV
jgi:HD superfamily phosphohydrolase